ncbi:hypothetical protein BT96DRAFT_52186 [Gymnopus androsaceus JB14]|uniref:Uncharacterized protein n=1 Tax=Gymnopus androsaceus JB14 TaxID=1447944 RepID=A0A6A4IB51_9AGAR|nr:hypothetical protein BT96DRAFT_52186 [Gymnopus androsaceus JB14]
MDLSYPTPGPPLSENIPSLTFDPSAVSPTLQQWSREISATQNEKQTRDSVQEWLKNVQLGEIPQERSTFGSTSRYEKPSPESEDDSWEMRRGGVDRRRNIELLAKAIPDHHLSYTNLDNLALDPDFHLQTDAGTSLAHSVLQSPRTSKRDILNALVGVMKRVEDLESQLDLKTKSMKKTMKPVSGAPGETLKRLYIALGSILLTPTG